MSYGHFSEDGREFIITRPDTPRPWANCLTNGFYTAIVTQTGGGYSFIGGPGYDRITRADPDFAASGTPGRYIYIRDNASGEFFNIGWQPSQNLLDSFECRHSQGYTTITASRGAITATVTYFVPLDDNLEIWRVSITNDRGTEADVSAFSYVEWVLGNYLDDLEQRQFSNLFIESGFQDNYVYATKHAWRRPDTASITIRETKAGGAPKFVPETITSNQAWGKWAYIALSAPVDSFDCDRESFIGRYGDISHPTAVERGECFNSDGAGRESIGAVETRFILPPGATFSFDVFVGVTMHRDDPSGVIARYGEPMIVDEKLQAVRDYWDAYLAKTTISTPDEELNLAANVWDKYQAWVSGRSHGLATPARDGASVVTFRETCYDILGMLPMDPEAARYRVVELLQHQHKDGSAVHHWEPRSDVGTRTGHIDDAIWLVMAITSFLKETGDLDFLNDRVKYYYSQSPASIYEHLIKALDFCLSQLSPRGLSLIGPGDWNDHLDEAGRDGLGESILTSQMLCWALAEASVLASLRDDRARARGWLARGREIAARINEHGWDDRWYLRAVNDRRDEIGSSSNASGKIFLTTQIWGIISGTSEPVRTTKALRHLADKLETPHGPAFLAPPFTRPDRHIGTITRFAPGMRENGGVGTLASLWTVLAHCILGHGGAAYEILRRTLYLVRSQDQDRYSAEPYVHSAYVDGPGSETSGRGSFSWPPGLAAWAIRIYIDWICGVRPGYGGLVVDPCVPKEWKEFTVVRPFRDAVYVIHVRNPHHTEHGVKRVIFDGVEVPPDKPLPDPRDRKVHDVQVEMGKAKS